MTIDKRLGELLDLVVKEGGSDIHIFAGGSPMFRVAGALIPIAKYPALTNEETEAMLKSIVPPELGLVSGASDHRPLLRA